MTRRRQPLVAVASAVLLAACSHANVTGLAPVRPELFDGSGRVEAGAYGAAYNAAGNVLAVKTGRGIGAVTSRGRVRLVTPPGSHAVEFAWMPNGKDLLIAEGPAATGELDVVHVDGGDRGRVPLDPVFSVGSGNGMAVSPNGREAVAVAEDLAALGGPERLSLQRVDLATGAVSSVGVTAVRGPSYVDAGHVLVTALALAGSRAEVVTLGDGTCRLISRPGEPANALGPVLDGAWLVYATEHAVWAVPATGGDRVRLTTLPTDATAVAVDPEGTQAVVGERNGDVEQLRAVSLHPLPVRQSAP